MTMRLRLGGYNDAEEIDIHVKRRARIMVRG